MMTYLVLAAGALVYSTNAEQVSNPGGNEKLAQFVIAGFVDGREKLQSGTFTVVGDMDLSQRPQYPVEGEIRIFSAFDFPRERFRFDRTQPYWVRAEAKGPKVLGRSGGRFVRTGDVTIQWTAGHEFASIGPPDKSPSQILMPFDVRLVGISNWGTLDYDIRWNDIVKYVSAPVKSVTEDEAGIYKVVWEPISPGVKLVAWFDKNKDFAPVAYKEYWGSRTKKVENWGEPRETGRTEWTRINEVWVPRVCEQTRHRTQDEFRRLRFNWTSVNQSPEESLFTREGVLPENIHAMDTTRGELKIHPSRELVERRKAQTEPIQSNDKRLLWIVVNAVILVVVVAVWLLVRIRRARSEEPPAISRDK